MNDPVFFPRLTTAQSIITMKALEKYATSVGGRDYYTAKEAAAIIGESRVYPASQPDVWLDSEDIAVIESALKLFAEYVEKIKTSPFFAAEVIDRKIPEIFWKMKMLKGE